VKTIEPWRLAAAIVGESTLLESLLKQQTMLEVQIEQERRNISSRIQKALEAF
jgi:hypothetical protein